jgi:hypothetical protein
MILIKQTDIDQLLDATKDMDDDGYRYSFPIIEIDDLLENTDHWK